MADHFREQADQVRSAYDSEKTGLDGEAGYEGTGEYPYAKYRMAMVLDILERHHCENILDLGCATGRVLREWVLKGHRGTGVDFSEELIAQGKKEMRAKNIDSDCLVVGDARDLAPYKGETFDAILALGLHLYMTEENEVRHLRELKGLLKPGGLIITSYINELVNLFTLNRYTVEFFEKLLGQYQLDEAEKSEALTHYKSLLSHPESPPSKPSDSYRRSHNPLTTPKIFEGLGYTIKDLFFCKFFAFPPLLESKIGSFQTSCHELEIEHAREWYAYFTAHAFCLVAQKPEV